MVEDARTHHIDSLLDLADYGARFRPEFVPALTRAQVEKAIYALLMMYGSRADDVGFQYATSGLFNALGIDYWSSHLQGFDPDEREA